jgi:hypothetical protein
MHRITIIALLLVNLSIVNMTTVHHQMMDLISQQKTKEMFKFWHYAMKRPYDINSMIAIAKYKVFKINIEMIEETNKQNLGYTLGLGKFTDLTFEEFTKEYLSYKVVESDAEKKIDFDTLADQLDREENEAKTENNKKLEADDDFTSTNWEYLYANNPARSQGSCGSCSYFAFVGCAEGMTKKLLSMDLRFSEQQLIDCNGFGCNGNVLSNIAGFVKDNGLASGIEYHYVDSVHPYCLSDHLTPIVQIQNISQCSSNCNIREYINQGPYATTIQVKDGLQHYRDGEWLPSTECTAGKENHAVVVVHVTPTSVRIRNSWNTSWGENGYGNISRKFSSHGCGTLNSAYQPRKIKYLGQ